MIDTASQLEEAIETIAMLRSDGGHVHSITNTVAQQFSANVLLACGATVSMTVNPAEIEDFAARADALHLNLGTLDPARMDAIRLAIKMAQRKKIPVTLDPVMVHVSKLRNTFAKECAAGVTLLRGNSEEIASLRDACSPEVCTVETGKVDKISFGENALAVENGDAMMGQVIATGCALGGLIAALSAKSANPMVAGLAGLVWFSVAGEIAAENSDGPGSFQPVFLDTLHRVSKADLLSRAKVSA